MTDINMPQLITDWLSALRSDNYFQTTETLKDETGHCCIGVLCEVLAATQPLQTEIGIEILPNSIEVSIPDSQNAILRQTCNIPVGRNDRLMATYPLLLWATSVLPDLNDRGASLLEIAALIEAQAEHNG